MIQFNLLPDIKIEYIKTLKLKRMVMTIAFIAVGASVGLLILMFSMNAVQKRHVSNLNSDIERLKTELDETDDLTKILTVQNQLNALPALYDGRPAINRLPGFIDQTTPVGIGITQMTIDFSTSTVEIIGDSKNLKTLNSFVDTLRYTTYEVEHEETEEVADTGEEMEMTETEVHEALNAFGNVGLVQFARDSEKATFTLSFSFDTTIFDITKKVKLTVPSLVTTRAEVPSPDLFNGAVEVEETTGTTGQ